jgi:hypothetical protein
VVGPESDQAIGPGVRRPRGGAISSGTILQVHVVSHQIRKNPSLQAAASTVTVNHKRFR